jgi:hypothetical protein
MLVSVVRRSRTKRTRWGNSADAPTNFGGSDNGIHDRKVTSSAYHLDQFEAGLVSVLEMVGVQLLHQQVQSE